MKTKSYQLVRSGRRAVQSQVTAKSISACTVETDDISVAVGQLLEESDTHVVVGTCVDHSRNRWEILSIDRKRIRSYSKLN